MLRAANDCDTEANSGAIRQTAQLLTRRELAVLQPQRLRDFLDLTTATNPVLEASQVIDVLVAHILEGFAAKR